MDEMISFATEQAASIDGSLFRATTSVSFGFLLQLARISHSLDCVQLSSFLYVCVREHVTLWLGAHAWCFYDMGRVSLDVWAMQHACCC